MFNLIVLILVTIVFLMFGYLITHVDIFSPFCVFCEMFLIAEFLCLFFSRMYKVEIHLNTILVIALGMISFGIVSAFFYMKRVDVRNYGEQHSRNYISINYLIQLVFLILEVLVVFYHAKYIKDVVAAFGYSTSSIFDIAGKYHVIALFNYNNFIEKAVSASFIYRHGIVWITAYLECLFFVFVIASFVCKLETKKQIVIVSFCWCIGVILYKGLDQYHVLGDPLYYLLWFYLGYRLENMIEWLKKHNIWKDSSILCLFGLVCLSFIVDKIVKIHFFHFLSSYIVCPFFMLIVLNYIVRHIKINGRAIKSLSDYGMGIYLYAEPLNYLFLFWFYRFCGIEFFGSEFGAAIIYFSRIVITPIIAIGITWILKKFNLKYLY